jgi:hypothetical protein
MIEQTERRSTFVNVQMAVKLALAFSAFEEWINQNPSSEERKMAMRILNYLCYEYVPARNSFKEHFQDIFEQYGQMDTSN